MIEITKFIIQINKGMKYFSFEFNIGICINWPKLTIERSNWFQSDNVAIFYYLLLAFANNMGK